MKVVLMSSYNQVCGIAEYTKYLEKSFIKAGHEVLIVGNYPYGVVTEKDAENVYRGFEITIQNPSGKIDCDVGGIVNRLTTFKPDVLHIQYESCLYHGAWFDSLLIAVKNTLNIPIVITYHSSCIFPFGMSIVDHHICHDENLFNAFPMKSKTMIMPMGVEDLPYVEPPKKKRVVSLGLGRNQDDVVKEAIKYIEEGDIEEIKGIEYETSYGNNKWLSHDELISFLQSGDIVVLYYPPIGASVSSSAACVALSAKRPVITSNTNWFQHLKKYVMFTDNATQLALVIGKLLTSEDFYNRTVDNIQHCLNERSWDIVAGKHVDLYESLLKQ